MASLDDILTTQKNGVVALNAINRTINQIGDFTSLTVTAPTVIYVGSGRLINCSVVNAGSATGMIYNSTQASPTPADSARLYTIPTTAGVFQLGLIFTSGLVIIPGTSQAVNLTYAIG